MRKFILHNHNFFGYKELLVSDVTGLGISFNEDGSYTLEDISFKMHFGIDKNAYQEYQDLVEFIAANQSNKFILEYQVDIYTKYCDVRIKNIPKTQKDNFNTINEVFTFDRTSLWYEILDEVFLTEGETYSFNNIHFEKIPVTIQLLPISGASIGSAIINTNGNRSYRIEINDNLVTNGSIVVYTDERKVDHYTPQGVVNGYDKLNHQYDSFIFLEKGVNIISMEKGDESDEFEIYIRHNNWVM